MLRLIHTYIHLNSIAKELARTGNVKIIVNDIEPMKEEAEKLCKEIRDAGVEAIALTADCKSLNIYVMLFFFASMYFMYNVVPCTRSNLFLLMELK